MMKIQGKLWRKAMYKRKIFSMALAIGILLTTVDISAFAKSLDEESKHVFTENDEVYLLNESDVPKENDLGELIETTTSEDTESAEDITEETETPEENENPDEEASSEIIETPDTESGEGNLSIPDEEIPSEENDEEAAVLPENMIPGASDIAVFSETGNSNSFIAPIDKPDASAVKITTAEELYDVRNDLYGSYVLMNDIDLSGYEDWDPIGSPTTSFCGKFDGQGHLITGLTIKESFSSGTLLAPSYSVGLFGVCNGAQIKNLALTNADVSVTTSSGYGYSSAINGEYSIYAGIIAGYITDSTVIYNCCTAGTVYAKAYEEAASVSMAGGLVGLADKAVLSFCSNAAGVQSYNGNVTTAYNAYAGGLVGRFSTEGTIDRSYNNGMVYAITLDFGNAYAGGLIGSDSNAAVEITNCYNRGQIQGKSGNMFCDTAYVGGIVAEFSGFINNVYNCGSVDSKAGGYVGGAAYAGGICGISSQDASISNSAIVQPTVAANAESGTSYQYRISYGGNKTNTITVDTVTAGSTNDADIIKSIEDMKISDPYINLLGWDFENIWEIGEDYPILKIALSNDPLETADIGIIEAVERYTSDIELKEVSEIFNSAVSDEEKRRLLFEYYNYDNMLDVRERLIQLSNMHDERWDYEGLIRDDMYLSWQYYNYLNNTPKGIAARACLYASGLVFNNELDEWIDPTTYWDGDYPGVEKYKSMLKDFIKTQSTSIEWYSYIKETQKFVNSSVGLWSKIEKGQIIKALNDAPDYTSCKTIFNNFVAIKINTSEGDKPFVFEGDKPELMEAMGVTKDLFKLLNITVNTIDDFMDVSCNLKIYETYHKFLMDIYDAKDLPWELVVAAYQLDQELGEGYWTPVQNFLNEVRDLCVDEVFDLGELIGIKDYLAVVSFTSFCINQFVDIGELVVNSCKTEGYAFLAMHYKNKLEQCKQDFLINKTEENAWKFYEAYVMLWELRIAGEKKFLDMSQLEGGTAVDNLQKYASKGTIAGLISDLCGFKDKKAVVDENIKLLSSFEFKYSPKNIPDNLLYLKKVIIECPVNVDFIAADGSLICTLNNKEETLISNDYGEFVCFYRATTGDYVKIAYFNDTTPIIINATCTEIGKVSYTLVETENHETYTTKGFNDVIVDPGDVIQVDVNQSTYTIDKDLDGKADIEGQQADKNRLFVQFDYQDNSFIKVEYVNEKGVVSLPEINTQNGKSFLGWYTEPDGKGEEFTSETIVNKSMTVYAKWKQLEMQKLSIPLANVMSDSTVIKGTKIVLSCSDQDAQIFYTLDGMDPTSDSNKYIDPIVVNEDIVIKAIAVKTGFQNSEIAIFNYKIEEAVEEPDINTYAVSFELQGHGVALDEYLNYTKIGAGSRIKEPTAPRDDKYLFTGWYKDADCLNKWNFEVDVVEKNMTLYAGWQSKDLGDLFPDDLPEDGVIPDGLWAAGITDATYTGTAITQSFRLYDSTKRLKEKTDYTVSYKNNKVAYTYTDEDYTAFEQTLADTGKRTRIGTFDPSKAPQVIIKMKGNYTGTRIIYFRILSADITEEAFSADDLTVTFSGKKQTPAPVLTWNGKSLKYGTDFYIPEYDSAKNDKTAFTQSGTYDLTITGKKNFTGKIPVTLTISESSKQIAMNKVSVKGIKSQLWTGTSIQPSGFTVSYKKDVLSETNGDYTVSFGENTAVGTGTVTLTGAGTDGDGDGYSYIGTKTISFKITGTTMNKVTVSGLAKNYTYAGEPIEPDVVLTCKANKNADPVTLAEGIQYTVDYQRNTNKGTATIIFTGIADGGYTGTKKQTFKIISSGIEDKTEGGTTIETIKVSFKDTSNMQDGVYIAPYMKGGAAPGIIVTDGDKTLVSGKDYTVSYLNSRKPALSTDIKAPTVVVKGKGNYTGTKQIPFSIAAKALTNENGIIVAAADKTVSSGKNGYRQKFKVIDADGKTLGAGDYEKGTATYTLIQTENADGTYTEKNEPLDKDSIVPAGSVIRITVQGKGIYAGGSATGTYRILNNGYDISKATIQISNQPYTGGPVTITEQAQFKEGKVYVKIGKEKRVLNLGQDIEVVSGSYLRNVNKGTAKVTFRGINDFGGTKTVTYKIGVRSITDFWQGIFNRITKTHNDY